MSIFSGPVKTEWIENDARKMRVLEPVWFIDRNGVVWTAPSGSIVDGASIPRICWRLIGSPFVGLYRRASVIHDVYCVTKSRPHAMVHQAFADMMKADKVDHLKLKTMERAVKMFGPKW